MSQNSPAKFDAYADSYEKLHAANVALTGEETGYFSEYKVDCLKRAGVDPATPVLDVGCGIGNVTEKLVASFSNVHGYEPSALSAERARARVPKAVIHDHMDTVPAGTFSTAILSTVLHHVPPAERPALFPRGAQDRRRPCAYCCRCRRVRGGHSGRRRRTRIPAHRSAAPAQHTATLCGTGDAVGNRRLDLRGHESRLLSLAAELARERRAAGELMETLRNASVPDAVLGRPGGGVARRARRRPL